MKLLYLLLVLNRINILFDSIDRYASEIVKLLNEKEKVIRYSMIRVNMMISFALYRQHCTFLDSDTTYIKDLTRLNRDMVSIFIYSLY